MHEVNGGDCVSRRRLILSSNHADKPPMISSTNSIGTGEEVDIVERASELLPSALAASEAGLDEVL